MDNANAVVILLTFSSDLASRVRNSKKGDSLCRNK